MQKKYWDYLVQVKSSVFYLDIYSENIYKSTKKFEVICAIASSASIGAWTVWTNLAYFWGLIIVVSQVLTSIKELFPFSKQSKVLKQFSDEMKRIYDNMEHRWYEVADGKLTEEEINHLLFGFKKKVTELEIKYMSEDLVEKREYMLEADKKCNEYFIRNFG